MVQRRIPPVTIALLALMLAMSLAAAVDAGLGGALYYHLALLPAAVWHGQVWRLLTWPFVIADPLALIFACVTLYVFGSDLQSTWGVARYLRYLIAVVLVAGVGTSLVGRAWPAVWTSWHLGGLALGNALMIAWARQYPDQPVSMYFVLIVQGRALVSVVIAITLVFAAFLGPIWALPSLLAIAAALLYMNRWHRRIWLKLKLYWIRRKLRVVD